MKIGITYLYTIFKYGYPPDPQDDMKALADLNKMGFHYLEMEGLGNKHTEGVWSNRVALKKCLEENNIHIHNFCGVDPDLVSMDIGKRHNAYERFKRTAELGVFFGAETLHLASYAPPVLYNGKSPYQLDDDYSFGNLFDLTIPDNFSWEKTWEVLVESCRYTAQIASQYGRTIIMEPRVGEIICSVDSMIRLIMCFDPFVARLKELIAKERIIGQILGVHLEWFLDTKHGADYFRRWHRRKENSGGLLVHKSTHHFDCVNWIIEEEPVEVSAFGTLRYYGPTREQRGDRCLTCEYQRSCAFYMDIRSEGDRQLYLDNEDADGYIRDRCVFSEDIDIEDSVSLSARYSGGAVMCYALTAHSPYEGYKMSMNGSEGRIEVENYSRSVGSGTEQKRVIRIYNRRGELMTIEVPQVEGGHGGGDIRLLHLLFRGNVPDPLGQQSSSWDGAMSCAIGFAANRSMKEGRTVAIQDLIRKP